MTGNSFQDAGNHRERSDLAGSEKTGMEGNQPKGKGWSCNYTLETTSLRKKRRYRQAGLGGRRVAERLRHFPNSADAGRKEAKGILIKQVREEKNHGRTETMGRFHAIQFLGRDAEGWAGCMGVLP